MKRHRQNDKTVARQLSFLMAKGLGQDAALKKILATAPDELRSSVTAMTAKLESSSRDPDVVARFAVQARALGAEPGRALAPMLAMSIDAGKLADGLYRSFKPELQYVTAIAAMGFLVSQLWIGSVWPGLKSIYAGVNFQFPDATRVFLDLGFFGFPLIFLLALLVAVSIWATVWLQSRRLRHLQPLGFRLIHPEMSGAGNAWLSLGLTRAFRDAGVRAAVALDEARRLLGTEPGPVVRRDLALSVDTETFDEELQYQLSDCHDAIVAIGQSGGQRILLALRYALYVLIGVAIIAFYEPIFYMTQPLSE